MKISNAEELHRLFSEISPEAQDLLKALNIQIGCKA